MRDKLFWVTALLSSMVMGVFMSGLISVINSGVDGQTLQRWLRSFFIGWPIAFTLSIVVLPSVRQFAAWICTPRG